MSPLRLYQVGKDAPAIALSRMELFPENPLFPAHLPYPNHRTLLPLRRHVAGKYPLCGKLPIGLLVFLVYKRTMNGTDNATRSHTMSRKFSLQSFRRHLQPFCKAMTWRAVGAADTFVLAYFVTGRTDVAASMIGIGMISHTILYVAHEKAWSISRVTRFFEVRGSEIKSGH